MLFFIRFELVCNLFYKASYKSHAYVGEPPGQIVGGGHPYLRELWGMKGKMVRLNQCGIMAVLILFQHL